MKKLNLKSTISILMVAAFLVLSSTGCKKKDEPAPTIPGIETFKINFSDFGTASDTTSGTKDVLTYQNWGHSFANVAVWNVIISVGLAVPVAAFNAALTQEAEYDHDGEYWIWDYNFNAGGLHRAELKGYLAGDSVVWEMRIDDFLWYYGRSHTDRTGGYWILNESEAVPTQLLRIAWTNVGGTPSISYTNIAPATSTHGAENGGYISYGVSTGEFDRFYYIYNKGLDNHTDIEWNSVDRHGHVKDPNKFGDSIWHCWNTSLIDDICE